MEYETPTPFEEKVASLFQPDTLLSEQYFSGYKSKQLEPGKRLMLAVLQDAVFCFQENIATHDPRKKILFQDAEAWIMEPAKDWVFSFENICEVLGLDPGYVRAGLLRFKQNRLSNYRRYAGKKHKAA